MEGSSSAVENVDAAHHVKAPSAKIAAPAKNFDAAFGAKLVAGAAAAAIAKTAVAPLERIKIIMQVQELTHTPGPNKIHGLRDAFAKLPTSQGGWTAFWRGNGANVVRLIPQTAIKFISYEIYLGYLLGKVNLHAPPMISTASDTGATSAAAAATTFGLRLTAGTLAGITTLLLTYPLDEARVLLTADMAKSRSERTYRGIFDCLLKVTSMDGIKGAYRGGSVATLSIVPYVALSLAAYDSMKRSLIEAGLIDARNPMVPLLLGSAAAIAAQSFCYPLDTMRRRLQVNNAFVHGVTVPGQELRYKGVIDCYKKMMFEEGWRAFFRGVGVNAIRLAPAAALQFAAYEFFKEGFSAPVAPAPAKFSGPSPSFGTS